MIKKFYIFAWLFLAGSIGLSILKGQMGGLQMLAFSVILLALVYAFALWAVMVNAGDAQTG
jgi:hypothetical protein